MHSEWQKLGTRKVFHRRPHVKGILIVIFLYSFFPLLVIGRRESNRCFDSKPDERKYLDRRLEARVWGIERNTCEGVGFKWVEGQTPHSSGSIIILF